MVKGGETTQTGYLPCPTLDMDSDPIQFSDKWSPFCLDSLPRAKDRPSLPERPLLCLCCGSTSPPEIRRIHSKLVGYSFLLQGELSEETGNITRMKSFGGSTFWTLIPSFPGVCPASFSPLVSVLSIGLSFRTSPFPTKQKALLLNATRPLWL